MISESLNVKVFEFVQRPALECYCSRTYMIQYFEFDLIPTVVTTPATLPCVPDIGGRGLQLLRMLLPVVEALAPLLHSVVVEALAPLLQSVVETLTTTRRPAWRILPVLP